MLRSIALTILLSATLAAQMPKSLYPWWSRPEVRRDLHLTMEQQREIQMTVRQYRPHLIDIRAEVNKAEIDLQAQFDHEPVDTAKANQAIERLVSARSDLTRTLSQLSLKLRKVLTEQQWQQLQRRRPLPEDNPAAPDDPTKQ